jgi:hypothetical protein
MKRRFVPEAGELQHRPGRDQELENTPSVSLRSEVESLAEDASEVPDESEDAAAFTVIHDKQDSGPDVSSGSTDSAPVDSGLRSNTSNDSAVSSSSALPSSAVEEVAPTAAPENKSLDQSAKLAPPQNGDAAITAAWQLLGEAESEEESGAAQSPVIQ